MTFQAKFLRIALASFSFTLPLVAQNAQLKAPWPQEVSDLKPEDTIRFGHLENGMRYVIVKNAEPQKRVSLRLHIDAGALMEDDDQQGLAHFLEHMMFNGTKHYSADELIPKMQRLGIAFGAHANAYTSFDETVYMLDLPNIEKDTLDLGFTVMRDNGDGALLKPEEIEKERGVILAEKTSRDSVETRLMEKEFADIFPNALIPKRFPIGKEEVIKAVPPQRFVDFYREHYIPKKSTFIVVGDIDIDAMEARIKESFSTWQNPVEPGSDPEMGDAEGQKGFTIKIYADPEVSETSVGIVTTKPATTEIDNEEKRINDMRISTANSIIKKRFRELAKKEGAKITSGSGYNYKLFNFSRVGGVSVSAIGEDWQSAVAVLEQEYRRALKFGFTQSELDEVKANTINSYEQAVKKKSTRSSESIATGLVNSINDNSVYTSPEEDLRIASKALDGLTKEMCHEALVTFFKDEDITLSLTTKTEHPNSVTELKELWEKSAATDVQAIEEKAKVDWAYSQLGTKAEIPTLKHIEDLDIYQGQFANGVKINLKKTDFKKNYIGMIARFGKGSSSLPKDKPALDRFANAIYDAGGLGKHSMDELNTLMAGKNIGSSFGIDENTFTLSGSTTPEDLELQLQFMIAQLTDPGFRPEAVRQFRKGLSVLYNNLEHSEQGPMTKIQSRVCCEDHRAVLPEKAALESYEVDDVKKWLNDDLTNAPIELSIVGDFDQAKLLEALASSFGTLPKREGSSEVDDTVTKLNFAQTGEIWNYTFDSKIPKGAAMGIWKTTGMQNDIKLGRRLNILSQILDDRLREKLREELGAAYSPQTYSQQSEVYDEFGYLAAISPGNPEVVEKVSVVMQEIAAKMAEKTITQDELDRSLKPTLSTLEKTKRENSYWLNTVLAQAQSQPQRLDWSRERDQDYRSITIAELNELAAKYYTKENAIRITITPSGEKKD